MKLIPKDVSAESLRIRRKTKISLLSRFSIFLQWMTNYLNVVRKALI